MCIFFSLIFWTNMDEESPSIERSFIDGSKRQTVVKSHLKQPNDIAVDIYGNRIYWADYDLKHIESAHLDGKLI